MDLDIADADAADTASGTKSNNATRAKAELAIGEANASRTVGTADITKSKPTKRAGLT